MENSKHFKQTEVPKRSRLRLLSPIMMVLVMLLSGMTMRAQTGGKITVTGIVTDATGEPLIGASVVQKGTTNASMTGIDGDYHLTAPSDATLVVTYIGFNPKEVQVNGKTKIDIVVSEDTKLLDEVVVTALGMKRDKKALGYAMQELKGDALLETGESNLANSLSGKVAGLQVIRSSNGIGGSSKIVLRGNNSLTGSNQPLIVIDGVPMDNFTGGVDDPWGMNGMDMGNGLSDINPEDIESMSVLKGASAAALYGSRAGNGVILITTKSGKSSSGIGITVNSGVSIETIFLKPELQNSFAQGSRGAFDDQARMSWGPAVGGEAGHRTYDNIDRFFNTGLSFTEGVSFQQQVDRTSVFASINRTDDKGMTPESKLNRTNITLRATTDLDKSGKWNLDTKASFVNTNTHNRPIQGINPANVYNTIYNLPRSINIEDWANSTNADGSMRWYDQGQSPQENPYWATKYRQNEDTRNRLLGSVTLKYKPTDWLDVELKGGTDYYTTTANEKVYAGGPSKPRGTYGENSETFYENNFSFLTSAHKDNLFDRLGGSFSFGGNLMMQERKRIQVSPEELLVPDVFTLENLIKLPKTANVVTNKKMNSLYGMLQLNWDGYVFLDITGRNDWSSTMSKANRSYFYPSFNFSTVITDMIPKLGGSLPEAISFAKLRASYAEVGNDLQPYQLYNTYKVSLDPNGNPEASTNSVLYNDNLRSELIKSYEVGLDLRFLNNRIGLDAAWYRTNSTRQLLDIPLDPFSGYASKKINAGDIQNQGFEVTLNGTILQNPKGLNWNAAANFSTSKSKINSLAPGIDLYSLGGRLTEIRILAEEGGDYGVIYGTKYQRVEDKSSPHYGKIIVDQQGLPLATATQGRIGSQNPDWMLGITNSFDYKGFSLSFLVDMRIGGDIFSGTSAVLHTSGNAKATGVNGREDFVVPNTVVASGDGYVENTTAANVQDYWSRLGMNNFGLSEAYLYDATNIRLRNITLGYTFDKKFLRNTPIEKLRLSATCNNVWMIHYNLPGVDPESVAATNSNAVGFENLSAPTARSYMFNLTIGF